MSEEHDMSWERQAACGNCDPEMFFPRPGLTYDTAIKDAKRICESCPVEDKCLDYAMKTRQEYGVWGGQSQEERATMRRRRLRMGLTAACERIAHNDTYGDVYGNTYGTAYGDMYDDMRGDMHAGGTHGDAMRDMHDVYDDMRDVYDDIRGTTHDDAHTDDTMGGDGHVARP